MNTNLAFYPIKIIWPAKVIRPTKVTLRSKVIWKIVIIAMATTVASQAAHAQLLAYEPFDYATGDFLDAAGDAQGGTGWSDLINAGNNSWHAAPGPSAPYDPNRILIEDNPVDWGYTDSQGNSLPIAGRVVNQTNWESVNRYVDLSGVDPGLLVDDPVAKLGVDGTEMWMSFLGLGTGSGGTERSANIGIGENFDEGDGPFGFNRSAFLGRPWKLKTDGTQDPETNSAWGVIDTGPGVDPLAATGDSYDEKVFFVARINFGGGADNAGGIAGDDSIDVWTNPDLGPTAPADADRNIVDFLFWTKNFNAIQLGGNADTLFDEIRIGLTYGDVAPIAAPSGADFDNDNDVDGNDFLDWQRNFGGTLDATDLANWQNEFGGGVGLLGAASAVPEPGTLSMVCLLLGLLAVGRRI